MLPGIRGREAQLYRVLANVGVPLLDAKQMTHTEAAIALARDISPADRAMLQRMHAERRERSRTGQKPDRGTPAIEQRTVRDQSGQVRRFEKGVSAD